MSNSFTPQQIEEFLQEFFDVVGARQYIGARYVPIFGRKGEDTIEWDNLAPYEPLTVVMHQGVSYVSKQYVPRDVEITDTDYWAETYRFNAQVEQYRQEVLGYSSRIDGAYDAVNDLRDDVAEDYVPFPDETRYAKYGTEGQVLSSLENGDTKWQDPVTVDAEIAGPLIDAWLDEHPEATTTVEDASITYAKFADAVMDTNTRVLTPPNTDAQVFAEGNTISKTLVDNGYLEITINITNPSSVFVASLYNFSLTDYINKKMALVGEFVSGPSSINNVVLGVSKTSRWSSSANPKYIYQNASIGPSSPILSAEFTLADIYTPAVDQTTIGVWIGSTSLAGVSNGTYKLRLYVMENVSPHANYSDVANLANVATNALHANIDNNQITYPKLSAEVINTNTRVLPHVETHAQIFAAGNTVTRTTIDNGYLEATFEVTNPSSGFIMSEFGFNLAEYINKKVSVIGEFVSGPAALSTMYLGISSSNDWGTGKNPLRIVTNASLSSSSPIAAEFTIRDIYSPLGAQTTVGFWIGADSLSGATTGTYKLRLYVMENVSPHANVSDVAKNALHANNADHANVADALAGAYIADIVFWGDSLTAGAGGEGTTYPGVCGNILDKTVKNCGVGGETANTIAARQGGNSMWIPAGNVNGTYNNGVLVDVFGHAISPLRQGNGGDSGNVIYVDNDECTLSITQTSSSSDDAVYTVAGYSGSAATVPILARFRGCDYDAPVTVIWVGQNGAFIGNTNNLDARIAIIDSMVAHLHNTNYVILGLSSGTDADRATEDATLLSRYGAKFFPTRRMLVDNGLTLQGITPTSQDETDIAAGAVPSSLRSDAVHLNADGYTALGKMIANKITALGYFKD